MPWVKEQYICFRIVKKGIRMFKKKEEGNNTKGKNTFKRQQTRPKKQ